MLRKTATEAVNNPHAELGGGVVKQRIARSSAGKSGGYRTIILLRKGTRAVFAYGFAKNERDSIADDDLAGFKALAKTYLKLTVEEMSVLVEMGELSEVTDDDDSKATDEA